MPRMIRNAILFLFSFSVLTGCDQSNHQAAGYIEGRYTYMATSVSGVLKKLLVKRGQQVQAGQLLFVLEQQPQSDEYNAAVETLRQSINARDAIAANLDYAKITFERYQTLVPKHAIQQSELDNAKSTYEATVAQLAQANATIAESQASLAKAKWTKDQKEVSAPVNARVFDIYYRLGEFAEAKQAILSLLAPVDVKAVFYVNAPALRQLQLNQKVFIHCEACKTSYAGRISFISPSAEYTPPVIYSLQTDEKLVFRIEAAFSPEVATQLHPGQPVTVTY